MGSNPRIENFVELIVTAFIHNWSSWMDFALLSTKIHHYLTIIIPFKLDNNHNPHLKIVNVNRLRLHVNSWQRSNFMIVYSLYNKANCIIFSCRWSRVDVMVLPIFLCQLKKLCTDLKKLAEIICHTPVDLKKSYNYRWKSIDCLFIRCFLVYLLHR